MRDGRSTAFMFAYSERDLTSPRRSFRRRSQESEAGWRRSSRWEKVSMEFTAHVGRRSVLVHGRQARSGQPVGRTDGFKTDPQSGVSAVSGFVDCTIERATIATLFGRA
jgi:hypothetical protein